MGVLKAVDVGVVGEAPHAMPGGVKEAGSDAVPWAGCPDNGCIALWEWCCGIA